MMVCECIRDLHRTLIEKLGPSVELTNVMQLSRKDEDGSSQDVLTTGELRIRYVPGLDTPLSDINQKRRKSVRKLEVKNTMVQPKFCSFCGKVFFPEAEADFADGPEPMEEETEKPVEVLPAAGSVS